MEQTYEENSFQVDILLEDLSDEGFEKIDQELQRIIGLSIAELEEEEETALLGVRFTMSATGQITQQYYNPEGAPDPYDSPIDLSDEEAFFSDEDAAANLDIVTADITWEDISASTKRTIREKIKAYFGKSRYVFKDDEHIGQARLDISNYIE